MCKYGRAARRGGRMGTESSQLRGIKASFKALECCVLVATNLQTSQQICTLSRQICKLYPRCRNW